jgi:hypothetical protein
MPREVLESTTQCHGSIFYIYNNTHKKAKQSVASGLSCHLSEIYGGEEPLESSRGIREGSNKKIILYGLFLYFKNILKKIKFFY